MVLAVTLLDKASGFPEEVIRRADCGIKPFVATTFITPSLWAGLGYTFTSCFSEDEGGNVCACVVSVNTITIESKKKVFFIT